MSKMVAGKTRDLVSNQKEGAVTRRQVEEKKGRRGGPAGERKIFYKLGNWNLNQKSIVKRLKNYALQKSHCPKSPPPL